MNIKIKKVKELPILQVAANLGIKPLKNNMASCPSPSHPDRNPSFQFYTETNSFYCFPCGQGGSVIDLVMLAKDCSLNEALELLESLL